MITQVMKWARKFFFILGVVVGMLLGYLVNEFVSKPDTQINNKYGSIKNKKGVQTVTSNPQNEIDDSKKKRKFKIFKRNNHDSEIIEK